MAGIVGSRVPYMLGAIKILVATRHAPKIKVLLHTRVAFWLRSVIAHVRRGIAGSVQFSVSGQSWLYPRCMPLCRSPLAARGALLHAVVTVPEGCLLRRTSRALGSRLCSGTLGFGRCRAISGTAGLALATLGRGLGLGRSFRGRLRRLAAVLSRASISIGRRVLVFHAALCRAVSAGFCFLRLGWLGAHLHRHRCCFNTCGSGAACWVNEFQTTDAADRYARTTGDHTLQRKPEQCLPGACQV